MAQTIPFDRTHITSPHNRSNPRDGEPAPPLTQQGKTPCIAYVPDVAGTLTNNGKTASNATLQDARADRLVTMAIPITHAVAYGITRDAIDRSGEAACGTAAGRSGLGIIEEQAQTLKAKGPGAVAMAFALRGRDEGAVPEVHEAGDTSSALRAASGGSSRDYVATRMMVRRLTPLECERLQGFPDHYTAIHYRGGMAKDGPRYKALGNSMAIPVMEWLGWRIHAVEQLLAERAA